MMDSLHDDADNPISSRGLSLKILAVLSNKGGSGKTTVSLSLAVAAVEAGLSVAVVDLDPQSNSADWGDSREADAPAVVSAQAARLTPVLDAARSNGVDLAVLDTAPRSEEAALKAARASNYALLIARPSIHDLRALRYSKDVLDLAKAPGSVLLNGVPHQGSHGDEAEAALRGWGLDVAPVRMSQRAAHYNAASGGMTAVDYEPRSRAAEECREVLQWVMGRAEMKS